MVKTQFLQKSLSTVAAVFAIPAIATASFAQTPAAAPAPSSLIGQTRCAKQSTAIFAQRSGTSALVRALAPNQSVTLSENTAQNGYIGVSAPAAGFVQTVNLKLCEKPNPNPNPPTSACRRVVAPDGLIVRQGGSTATPVVGQVAFNTQVTLSTTPPTSRVDAGRVWVQIAKPVSGWVSNGFQNAAGTNLVLCK